MLTIDIAVDIGNCCVSCVDSAVTCVCVWSVGPGEQGSAVILSAEEEKKKDDLYKVNGFNAYVSDKISLDRSLQDIRHPESVCLSVCLSVILLVSHHFCVERLSLNLCR